MKTQKRYNNSYSLLCIILALVVLILPYWGIHYTSDWKAYNYYFEHPSESRDYFFSILATFFGEHGYVYEDLYKFNILLIGFCYLFLFRKTNTNPILLALITVGINYVALGNQIRFFLAFPCCVLSFYFFIDKKYINSILLIVFAILNHKTTLILFSILLLSSIIIYKSKTSKQALYLVIANVIIYSLLNYSISFDEKYNNYLSSSNMSSLIGGLFNIFPYLFPIFFSYKLNQIVSDYYPILTRSNVYKFLFISSIATSVFLLSGIQIQVLSNRFIMSFLPIFIGFFFFVSNNTSGRVKQKANKYMCYTILLMIVWTYLVKPILGFHDYFLEAEMMLSSYSLDI